MLQHERHFTKTALLVFKAATGNTDNIALLGTLFG
jgi:hypothetical protein